MNVIDAESEPSWPTPLLEILAENAKRIAAYHATRARIDRAADDDVMLRINRPPNSDRDVWDEVLQVAEGAVSGHTLLGFHATRLTRAEQAAIRTHGLRALSATLLLDRIADLVSAGSLAVTHAARLRSLHQARDDNRTGMLWFSFTRAPLRDEGAVGRLFRSWGGEALYNSHEDDAETGPVLRALGEPCIVTAAVRIEGLQVFMDVGERLVNEWCAARKIKTGHGRGFEGYTRADIPADRIRIIPFDDPQFAALTGHPSWRTPLS